ncbi:hypothetical protein GDO81_025772 [Engystomops pustulosus]|uniref:Uncharacterized protein n=1 Tax=Engystomops pustulosus TaxID=76066 RepID=A0AAV6YRY9_ENGPU|nr:hypothetical protein GDO81_025772 [Engystomops pustulosus]
MLGPHGCPALRHVRAPGTHRQFGADLPLAVVAEEAMLRHRRRLRHFPLSSSARSGRCCSPRHVSPPSSSERAGRAPPPAQPLYPPGDH